MSEPEVKKKNKKKKKKSGKKPVIEENSLPPPENKNSQNDSENGAVSINEVLPNKVGMTTKFNDVEVTMTHDGIVNNTTTSTASKKKKKKKKKSKQETTTEVSEEAKTSEDNSETNLFKFDKNRIELVNHPEISVTLSKAEPVKEKEPHKSEKENPPVSDKKDKEPEVAANPVPKKKKKKKKKKKTTEDSTSPTEQPNSESADASYKTPTYVKLPAAGDSCVLVVSHENFANENNTPVKSEAVITPNGNSTVLIRNKDRIDEPKGGTLLAPQYQTEPPSINIIPISSDQNKTSTDKPSTVTMESSLQKVKEMINKVNSNDSASLTEDGPVNSEGPALTKAQLKAERRAKQEAQRAAKLAKTNEKNASNPEGAAQKKTTENLKLLPQVKQSISENAETAKSKSSPKSASDKDKIRGSEIFSHLPQVKDLTAKQMSEANLKIHPAIIELGVHFNKGTICGSNARCVGFLGAFREAISDYKKPPGKEFSRDLDSKLKMYLNFLNNCRPLSVSITNAVRFLQHQINRIPKDSSEEEAKQKLYNSIHNFVKEEILLAKKAICMSATAKIVDGDNIVVYAYSSIVKDVLCKAHDQNKSFHVTVIDSGPKFEGLQMLHLLSKYGLQCAYKSIDSVCSVMKKASKVFIGAHALLLNGYVMSRVGCKQLALVASSYSVPVLVCCETYKFCDRSLSDSFVHNELGKPEDLIQTCLNKKESFADWQFPPSFQTCNILYDVTPSHLIYVIITEKGLLPCSSVPVVLRVKYATLQE